jgi:hypothetical protein
MLAFVMPADASSSFNGELLRLVIVRSHDGRSDQDSSALRRRGLVILTG